MKALAAIVPVQLRVTGQALFGAVVFGGAHALGYWISGVAYDHFGGAAALFAWAALVEVIPIGLALAFYKYITGSDPR